MPEIMLVGAEGGADSPVAPGVKAAPFVVNIFEVGRGWDGINVLSSCDDADDSFADSGLVGCLRPVGSDGLESIIRHGRMRDWELSLRRGVVGN